MKYVKDIRSASDAPQALEEMYQAARRAGDEGEFRASLLACYRESPDNRLYAAWYYRLWRPPEEAQAERRRRWALAIPLSAMTGLVFWILSDPRLNFPNGMPYLMLVWAPVGTCFIIAYLTLASKRNRGVSLLAIAGLLALSAYATCFAISQPYPHYRDLMMIHLPLLAWIGTGVSVLGLRPGHEDRFAFLVKSIEVFITGGLYALAGMAFVGITVGMFQALGLELSNEVRRLLVAGGGGLIPVMAVASAYDPYAGPTAQRFQQGLSGVIATLMRFLLPLTLIVLVIYLVVIPFNFMAPFRRREVLIVYNVMLFAVMGLLIGATPVRRPRDLPTVYQSALRDGIVAVATLAVLISLYALSATVYRTVQGGITVNRLTVIGWNSINIGILAMLAYGQLKDIRGAWVSTLQRAFSRGTLGYIAWGLFLTLAIPWLFGA